MERPVDMEANSIDLDVWRLLPWLANGTLEGSELERVLDHLKHSPRCREELLFLSELRYAVEMASSRALEVPEDRLTGLMERIEAHERTRDGGGRRTTDAPAGGSSAALSVLAQAALVVLLAGALWWLVPARSQSEQPRFQTLSAAESPAHASWRLRLIPEDGLSEADLRQLVLDVGAEIVAGPTAAGVYTLGWTRQAPPAPPAEIAETLRADARVALAEPVRGP